MRIPHLIAVSVIFVIIVFGALLLSIQPQNTPPQETPKYKAPEQVVIKDTPAPLKLSGTGKLVLGGQKTDSFKLEGGTYNIHTTYSGNGHYVSKA